MHFNPVPVVILLASLSAPRAQLNVRAVTTSGLVAYTDAMQQNVAPNTDVSNGTSVAAGGSNYGSASASSSFTVTRTARTVEIGWRERAAASGGTNPYASAGVGTFSAANGIALELSSPVPTTVRLVVTTCMVGAGYSGNLNIPGRGTVAMTFGAFCQSPDVRTFDLPVGPTPTALTWSNSGVANGARGGTSFDARWTVTITPAPSCPGTTNEPPCGATLESYATLNLPGTWLGLTDTSNPGAAFLLVGTQALRVPIEGCFLATDFPILLPFGFIAPGRAEVYLPPVGYPLQVRTQGITFGTAGLHASNGLTLNCQ